MPTSALSSRSRQHMCVSLMRLKASAGLGLRSYQLRNHRVGWNEGCGKAFRNGGVPRNPVFLMPATHCTF